MSRSTGAENGGARARGFRRVPAVFVRVAVFGALLVLPCAGPVGAALASGPAHASSIGAERLEARRLPQSPEDRGEIEQGREADRAIEAEFGFYDDDALQAYVAGIGARLAAVSERPQLPWTFRVLDSPVVNAFALPGGFVYVTRGLLAFANSEAELAGVLGHEIGHVTGRHGRGRQTRSTLFTLGLLAGAIFSETARDLLETGLPQQLAGLVLLKYSRDQELDADERGIDYATAAGYNPYGIGGFFATLQSLEQESDRRQVPGWASTHPQVDDRIERSERWAAEALGRAGLRADDLVEGRAELIGRIDGIVFGENPREGFVRGDEFLHPDLRFVLGFPTGWSVRNERAAVTAVEPREEAYVQLRLAPVPAGTSMEDWVRNHLRELDADVRRSRRTRINDLEALEVMFSVRSDRTDYAVLAYWVEYEGRVYQLFGVTSPARFRGYEDELGASMRSFRELDDPEILAVDPARVDVVEAPGSMRLAGVLEAFPRVSVPAQTVAILNHLTLDALVGRGEPVKLVFGGVETDPRTP